MSKELTREEAIKKIKSHRARIQTEKEKIEACQKKINRLDQSMFILNQIVIAKCENEIYVLKDHLSKIQRLPVLSDN